MKKKTLLFFLLLPLFLFSENPLKPVWDALENQDRALARKLLNEALSDPQYGVDAMVTLLYLNELEGNESSGELFRNWYSKLPDPSPYLYTHWLDDPVLGSPVAYESARVRFLQKIIQDARVHESVRNSGYYSLGMSNLLTWKEKKALPLFEQIGALENWQVTGPFDNTNGSGHVSDYPPIHHPERNASFYTRSGLRITWFTPKWTMNQGWTIVDELFLERTGTAYFQTFVKSPSEQKVLLSLGGYGQMKVWLNDVPAIVMDKERKTDMDVFVREVNLKKGYNRILVQVSFTNNVRYPNFIVRLLDEHYKLIPGLEHRAAYADYPKGTAADLGAVRPHFAEEYFRKKLENDPDGVQNYILLAKTYLRSDDFDNAIKVLRKGLESYPNNPLLNYELVMTYQDFGNRTETLRQLEKLRTLSPEIPVFFYYDFKEALDNDEYQKAERQVDKLAEFIGEDREEIHEMRINLMAAREENEKLLKAIELGFRKFPKNPFFVRLWYLVQKNLTNNVSYASSILENYLDKRYNSNLSQLLIEEKKSVGNMKGARKWIEKRISISPDDYNTKGELINFYYNKKDYDKALDVCKELFLLNPYMSGVWVDKGRVYEAMGEESEAIRSYKRALQINPNLFDERAKLRELEGKNSIYEYFEKTNAYGVISKALEEPVNDNYNFEFVFYEDNYVVYPGGAYNKYGTLCARIFNQSGLDYWKESSVGYRGNEALSIDKAEVIKKNGEKIRAEVRGNKVVFPSLEIGDAVYLIYKIDGYASGRLSNEFWEEWYANSFVPLKRSVFRLMVPQGQEPQIVTKNFDENYLKEDVDDFTKFEWVLTDPEVVKDEPYTPAFSELAKQVQVSTVEGWDEIAEWYHYVGLSSAVEDVFVEDAYDAIFGEKELDAPVQRAKAIYNYLCDNIRYSYVDFRQSGQIPQIPSQTLTTQLGDCKDLATLYHVLAKKAGLETHLVLVTTRDNGEKNMLLPTDQFNHAIIAIDLPEGRLYQELTDAKLPFGAMPNSLVNAQALVIPNDGELDQDFSLVNLPAHGWIKPVDYNSVSVSVDGTKLKVRNQMHAVGSEAGVYRNFMSGLTQDREKEEVTGLMARYFNNPIVLNEYHIENLDSNTDTFSLTANFDVSGAVLKLGGMYAFKVPYLVNIVDSKTFALTDRKWPFTYWSYETADEYTTEVLVHLPEGVEVTEMPADFSVQNNLIEYQLTFEKTDDGLIRVLRKVKTNRSTLPASEFEKLKETAQKILEAEEQHIVFR